MRQYLATLHKRPDHHKKGFALAISGGTSLIIFAVWLSANFSPIAQDTKDIQANAHEAGPIEAIGASLSSSWDAIKESVGSIKDPVNNMNTEVRNGYEEMKTKTFDQYGR